MIELNITEEEIMQMDLTTTMEYINQLMINPTPKTTQNYLKIRFGINIEFDIYKIITGNYLDKSKKNRIIIEKKEMHWSDFFTEMNERTALAKRTLISSIGNNDFIEGREILKEI